MADAPALGAGAARAACGFDPLLAHQRMLGYPTSLQGFRAGGADPQEALGVAWKGAPAQMASARATPTGERRRSCGGPTSHPSHPTRCEEAHPIPCAGSPRRTATRGRRRPVIGRRRPVGAGSQVNCTPGPSDPRPILPSDPAATSGRDTLLAPSTGARVRPPRGISGRGSRAAATTPRGRRRVEVSRSIAILQAAGGWAPGRRAGWASRHLAGRPLPAERPSSTGASGACPLSRRWRKSRRDPGR